MSIEDRVTTLELKVSEIEGRQQTQLDATGILTSILTELRAGNEQRDRLRTELRAEMGGLRAEMRTEMGELRTEMRAGFDRVEAVLGRMDERVARLEASDENV
ncbi:hypothetical protein [Synechococcus sp. PCC 7336]|uniref:hypothetical protein n=1 Tax=Synechococcus sp. PCC 7336 TaxID=195250 RepID=UPI000349E3B3|nr:hypothetical protein [Synechococcus sp. PCC 7336]